MPLYLASQATGPSFGRLIDFKRKEEVEQLLKSNTFEPSDWKTRLLDRYKHSDRSPIPFNGKVEDNFLKEIQHAEGNTAKGFEADFHKVGNKTSSPEKVNQEEPKIDEETTEPTTSQKVNASAGTDEERQGRNPVAKNVEETVETPSKKESDEDTTAHEAGEPTTPLDEGKN